MIFASLPSAVDGAENYFWTITENPETLGYIVRVLENLPTCARDERRPFKEPDRQVYNIHVYGLSFTLETTTVRGFNDFSRA